MLVLYVGRHKFEFFWSKNFSFSCKWLQNNINVHSSSSSSSLEVVVDMEVEVVALCFG
jgi:hypothetical protein